LDLGVSAGWVNPSSRGLWGGHALLLPTGAAGNRKSRLPKQYTVQSHSAPCKRSTYWPSRLALSIGRCSGPDRERRRTYRLHSGRGAHAAQCVWPGATPASQWHAHQRCSAVERLCVQQHAPPVRLPPPSARSLRDCSSDIGREREREREREQLVDSHGRWKGPCLRTAHMTI
jgi:hypothetical protein